MKIDLTIKTTYIKDWNVYEGLRELLQNCKDEDSLGHYMSVDYQPELRRVILRNENSNLPKASLLLGYTTKENDANQIGQFGEGLKLGCLALTRLGKDITIRTGTQKWIPVLRYSEQFEEEILSFDIEDHLPDLNAVIIHINNITNQDWNELEQKCLFLRKNYLSYKFTEEGEILLNRSMKGMIFVKGLFIEKKENFDYGYNFTSDSIKIDRDRKLVSPETLIEGTCILWAKSVRSNESGVIRVEVFNELIRCLMKENKDLEALDSIWSSSYWSFGCSVCEAIKKRLHQRFGQNTLFIENHIEEQAVKTFLPEFQTKILPTRVLVLYRQGVQFKQIISTKSEEVYNSIENTELTQEEIKNLHWAIQLINNSGKESLSRDEIKVVEFRSSTIEGLYRWHSKTIEIAKHTLKNKHRILAILIHEVSHRYGTDGDRTHTAKIEQIWSNLYKSIENNATSQENSSQSIKSDESFDL